MTSWNFKNSPRQLLKRDMLRVSATLDFPSVAAQGSGTLTVTVKGAKVGDTAQVSSASATGPTAGLVLQAWVSATDTVTVRATNVTGAAIDAASASYAVTVWKK